MPSEIEAILQRVGCVGTVCAQTADAGREVSLSPDEPVVAASVIKVLVAVEAERQFAAGGLDRAQRVRLPPETRTPGPVGFSLYDHDVEVSIGDLLVPMLTISDNVATDALLERITMQACNRTAASLGLTGTLIVSDLATTIDGLAQAAGFADWTALLAWDTASPSETDRRTVEQRIREAPQMQPATATRTTARDMCTLLTAIWTDEAGPPDGCRRVRQLMRKQLTRHRIASGFRPPFRVAAKSGSLAGVFRHEIGVVESADGWWPVAVFTTSLTTDSDETAVNSAIGEVAARAVARLDP